MSAIGSAERGEIRLWIAQRASAGVLGVCVAVHLVTIIWAVQGGLSAGEILGRTRGNVAWASFYGVFVAAAAVHAPIGLRAVLHEWLGWRGAGLAAAMYAVGLIILVLGLRAVWAVFG